MEWEKSESIRLRISYYVIKWESRDVLFRGVQPMFLLCKSVWFYKNMFFESTPVWHLLTFCFPLVLSSAPFSSIFNSKERITSSNISSLFSDSWPEQWSIVSLYKKSKTLGSSAKAAASEERSRHGPQPNTSIPTVFIRGGCVLRAT